MSTESKEALPYQGIAALLTESPLFDSMSWADLQEIAHSFDVQYYRSGQKIIKEGLVGHDFYVILGGKALLEVSNQPLQELLPGDFFGEIGILRQGTRPGAVTAQTGMQCLVIHNRKLEELVLQHPILGLNLLRGVISRYADVVVRGALAQG